MNILIDIWLEIKYFIIFFQRNLDSVRLFYWTYLRYVYHVEYMHLQHHHNVQIFFLVSQLKS